NGLTVSQCTELETQELKEMYNSVNTNGGFYVARYEAGKTNGTATDGTVKPVSQKGATVWNNIPWGINNSDTEPGNGAVTVSRKMYAADAAVVSTLMYGVQYDAVLRFIESSGGKSTAQMKDSSSWGNHKTSSNKLENTGSSEIWKTNNIYDLAGNVWEWTMEACLASRVYRSGSYYYSGRDISTSYRNYCSSVVQTDTSIGFRVALYVK
ncbi:MAG: hypothetical protein RSE00_01960, partial [Clostridia bacterium]